ncbi:MAG: hypothetical protein ICV77_11355 [Cyanobacteria bacterium Co-bin8]|nr:hypothetical protein [Cyanobacteria bacterium Co-bin8]
MNRSWGIGLIAWVQFFISGLSLITGALLILLLTGQVELFSADLTRLSPFFKGLVVAGFLISILGMVSAVGLYQLKRWGWVGSLLFQGLCLLNNGLALLGGQAPSFGVYFSATLCTAIIAGLCQPSIRSMVLPQQSEVL